MRLVVYQQFFSHKPRGLKIYRTRSSVINIINKYHKWDSYLDEKTMDYLKNNNNIKKERLISRKDETDETL